MRSSSVSLFLVLGGWCHSKNQRDPAQQEHDTPWRCPWNAMHFQYAILKLSNGTYLHGREHRSAMRSGLQNLSRCVGKVPPHFCVWTLRQPRCGNVGALCLLWQKASKLCCLLGTGKREKNYTYLLTPEGSKSLKNADVGITLGF